MPAYTYDAMDAEGQRLTGIVEADGPRAARTALRGRGLVPLEVRSMAPAEIGTRLSWRRPAMSAGMLTLWTRQLAGLLESGLPLERVLTVLLGEAETDAQRELVANIRSDINNGASLADSLARYPRVFRQTYCAAVHAGEEGGRLSAVLARLASDLEDQQDLRSRLAGALLYPAVLTLVAVFIVLFLLAYVVPQVAGVFADARRALPPLTAAVLGLSGFLQRWGGAILVLLVLGLAGMRWALTLPAVRMRVDEVVLKVPVLGRMVRDVNAARFAAALSLLVGSGVPILKALQIAAQGLGNHAMRADALDTIALVGDGSALSTALALRGHFPDVLCAFINLGEQTGQLPEMLRRAGAQLGPNVQRRAMQLATLVEPFMILLMGAVVLIIVMAIMLPIVQINTAIR